jgi:hypothetical protein
MKHGNGRKLLCLLRKSEMAGKRRHQDKNFFWYGKRITRRTSAYKASDISWQISLTRVDPLAIAA